PFDDAYFSGDNFARVNTSLERRNESVASHVSVAILFNVFLDVEKTSYTTAVLDTIGMTPHHHNLIADLLMDFSAVVEYRVGDISKKILKQLMIGFIAELFGNSGR